jgi:hypothetical protein
MELILVTVVDADVVRSSNTRAGSGVIGPHIWHFNLPRNTSKT